VNVDPETGEQAPPPDEAMTAFEAAQTAFYEGDYLKANAEVEKALIKAPNDTGLHEFHALTYFALKKYKEAAGNLYAVLSVAPGWDWTTMSGLYPSVDVYTEQLRALEEYVKANTKAPDGHFVLAYHYMTAGHTDAAANQLKQVVELAPTDQVSKQLLALVSPPSDKAPKAATPPTPGAKEAAPDPTTVVGDWKAKSPGGTVELGLKEDNAFTWKYAGKGAPKEFEGTYQLAGDTLVLEYDNGGTMVAKVSSPSANQLAFKVLGGPPNDPGLSFTK
jgi:tetratricopeptide (TPR) repeat protein